MIAHELHRSRSSWSFPLSIDKDLADSTLQRRLQISYGASPTDKPTLTANPLVTDWGGSEFWSVLPRGDRAGRMVSITTIVVPVSINICEESFYFHRQTMHQIASMECSTTAGQSAMPTKPKDNPAYARSATAAAS